MGQARSLRRPRRPPRRRRKTHPRELATLTGRKEASLSRTLKRFAELGVVSLVHIEIGLTGRHSAVAVHAQR